MEEIRALVKEHYGLKVLECREIGSRTMLVTDRGVQYLYSCPAVYRYKKKFMEKVQKHLGQHCEYGLLPVTKTVDGQRYVLQDDEMYFLQLGVREAALLEPAFEIGQALARFHLGTAGFTGERLFYPYRSLGNWPSMWRKKLRQYSGYRDEMDVGGGFTPFDEYLLTTYTYVHHIGELSVQYLLDSGYHQVVKDTADFGKIAYQNFDEGYLLFADNGTRYFAGEWSWVIDMRARDVGQWIKTDVRKNGWNEERIGQFLDGYNSVSALSGEEYAIIYSLLLYPGRFLKIVETYRALSPEERESIDFSDWRDMLDEELIQMESGLRNYPAFVAARYGAALPPIEWLWRTADEETERIYDEKSSS
ncbi:protein kinase family protein [Brevibacillus migulae]|uniref:hypothetical protein n=1 Tax=Brevibacillus migulae TaxID=1644114 RepID=UPI001F1EFFF3|nr:hypothetical protein [Brevibacillus migulae]